MLFRKKNFKSNNIILLIGNGFDLAHGLKTSYNNFAEWFIMIIEKEIINSLTTKQESSKFLKKEFLEYFLRNTPII